MTEYQAERLKFFSWLHAAAKDLIEHKRRLSADTYEVRVSDINAILAALGCLAGQDRRSEAEGVGFGGGIEP